MEATRQKFKKINPEIEAEKQRKIMDEHNIKRLELVNDTIPIYKEIGKQGSHLLRLLPQPEESEDSYSRMVPYIFVQPKNIPGYIGYMSLTPKQEQFLSTIRSQLRENDDFKNLISSRNNPTGIDLSVKYRELFLGFLPADPMMTLYVIVLPSNGYNPNPTQVQVGTIIKQLPYEKTSSGTLRYGDIFDIENGKLIQINVLGAGKQTTYKANVDECFPLTDAKYDKLLNQVVPLSSLVATATTKQFFTYLRTSLTDAMFKYIVEINRIEETMKGKAISEEDWEYVLSLPAKRIGYTAKPAAQSREYSPRVAPPIYKANPNLAPVEDDPEDEIPMGDVATPAPAPTPAPEKPEPTEDQKQMRLAIENLRATGMSDATIPGEMFDRAGWPRPAR